MHAPKGDTPSPLKRAAGATDSNDRSSCRCTLPSSVSDFAEREPLRPVAQGRADNPGDLGSARRLLQHDCVADIRWIQRIGKARADHARQPHANLVDLLKKTHSVHTRHGEIREHEIETGRVCNKRLECGDRASVRMHPIAKVVEQAAIRLENQRVVVNEQD